MTSQNTTPADLADAVFGELSRRQLPCPPREALVTLFELMFYASLHTEEGQRIEFHICYVDPNDPDPHRFRVLNSDRWQVVRLSQPIEATIPNLVKLANATEPTTSSFAVYNDDRGRLIIWGLIDQGIRAHRFLNFESDQGPDRAGLFQTAVRGVGHIVVYIDYKRIAELRINKLQLAQDRVLFGGPVFQALFPGIRQSAETVMKSLEPEYLTADFVNYYSHIWAQCLSRLLQRTRLHRHGGAVLIAAGDAVDDLNIKYEAHYERFRTSIEHSVLSEFREGFTSRKIRTDYIRKSSEVVPTELYWREQLLQAELAQTGNELDGVISFISTLTRVDGLVLMTPTLELRGFGVEITRTVPPENVFLAGDREATAERRQSVDYNHFGTRHRSMMRYCSGTPGSVGFVVSQDGEVRAITRVQDQLLIWENISLQLS